MLWGQSSAMCQSQPVASVHQQDLQGSMLEGRVPAFEEEWRAAEYISELSSEEDCLDRLSIFLARPVKTR